MDLHHQQQQQQAPLVALLMSSKFDMAHCDKISKELALLNIDCELRVASPFKSTPRFLELVSRYESLSRPVVFIVCSGRSNAMSGLADANVSRPVISCPPYSEAFGGNDIFSSIRMHTGVAPMLVLDPVNAAWAAAKIFAMSNPALRTRMIALQNENASKLHVDD